MKFKISWLFGFVYIAIAQGCAIVEPTGRSYADLQEAADNYTRANDAYHSGLLTEAEMQYIKLTKNQPNFFDAWFKLGNIYVRTGQFEGAIKMYEQCIKIKPDDVRPWHNLALTRIKQSLEILTEGMQKVTSNSKDQEKLDLLLNRIAKMSIGDNSETLPEKTVNPNNFSGDNKQLTQEELDRLVSFSNDATSSPSEPPAISNLPDINIATKNAASYASLLGLFDKNNRAKF